MYTLDLERAIEKECIKKKGSEIELVFNESILYHYKNCGIFKVKWKIDNLSGDIYKKMHEKYKKLPSGISYKIIHEDVLKDERTNNISAKEAKKSAYVKIQYTIKVFVSESYSRKVNERHINDKKKALQQIHKDYFNKKMYDSLKSKHEKLIEDIVKYITRNTSNETKVHMYGVGYYVGGIEYSNYGLRNLKDFSELYTLIRVLLEKLNEEKLNEKQYVYSIDEDKYLLDSFFRDSRKEIVILRKEIINEKKEHKSFSDWY